jgi:hypothetical protein
LLLLAVAVVERQVAAVVVLVGLELELHYP